MDLSKFARGLLADLPRPPAGGGTCPHRPYLTLFPEEPAPAPCPCGLPHKFIQLVYVPGAPLPEAPLPAETIVYLPDNGRDRPVGES